MALTQIDFDEKEELIINNASKRFNLNKPKTIRKIIREYKFREEKNDE